MTTRTIVTSQPDVACDICARRLLRGEQPDHFIVDGRRRTVCELCAPRAAHEGWQRETDRTDLELPPARPRRGRSLFDRLLRGTRGESDTRPARSAPLAAGDDPAAAPFDVYAEQPALVEAPAEPARATAAPVAAAPVAAAPVAAEAPGYLEQAVAVFNASEYPRRVAGVSRSLGAPEVTVRSAEHLSSVVRIVVAWELSWYRYEVDLSEDVATVEVIGQGTELSELDRDERLPNAAAGGDGTLALAG